MCVLCTVEFEFVLLQKGVADLGHGQQWLAKDVALTDLSNNDLTWVSFLVEFKTLDFLIS